MRIWCQMEPPVYAAVDCSPISSPPLPPSTEGHLSRHRATSQLALGQTTPQQSPYLQSYCRARDNHVTHLPRVADHRARSWRWRGKAGLWTVDPSHARCMARVVPLPWRGVAGSEHALQMSCVGVSPRTPSRDGCPAQCSKPEPQEHSWWVRRHQSLSASGKEGSRDQQTKLTCACSLSMVGA